MQIALQVAYSSCMLSYAVGFKGILPSRHATLPIHNMQRIRHISPQKWRWST